MNTCSGWPGISSIYEGQPLSSEGQRGDDGKSSAVELKAFTIPERNLTMRINLISIVIAAGFVLGATAAFADNNWAFDDPYWKRPTSAVSVQPTQSDEIRGKYDQVDRYNN
jgi:hypothetical protein